MSNTTYTVTDENNVPAELTEALAAGKTLECEAAPGLWVPLDTPEFRCSVTYRIAQ